MLPSATQSSGRGLGLRRVAGGCYDRGGRRSNLPEAEQLVEALLQELPIQTVNFDPDDFEAGGDLLTGGVDEDA